jgi:TetR/AcrR family transcriptional repressor of uid operon
MIPLTCGRTSDVSNGVVRPGRSAVSVTGSLATVITETTGGPMSGGPFACGGPQPARRMARVALCATTSQEVGLNREAGKRNSKSENERSLFHNRKYALACPCQGAMAVLDEDSEDLPDRSPKATRRRRQVLEAASQCFRHHGFHGCSMAQIATGSGMSVGHIYRYFAGKDEIIKAIVQRNLEEVTSRFLELERAPGNLLRVLIDEVDDGVSKAADPERVALMLEVWAEAGRNPEVAMSVQAADLMLREHLARVFLRAGAQEWSDGEVEARVEMLALIFEGVALRMTVHPDLDRRALADMIRRTIKALFAPDR